MKSLPNHITIAGKRIKIKIVADLDCWGEYHHDDAVIRIATRTLAKASTLRETLRHEIMHAALAISGVAFMEDFSEESVVRCMDEIFFPCWDRVSALLVKSGTLSVKINLDESVL